MSEVRVELREVSYGEVKALEDINLTLGPGLYVVVGRSGSGKSTLGKVISGVIPHIEKARVVGRVAVSGLDVLNSNIYKVNKTVAYLAQSPYDQVLAGTVIDELTLVADNVGRSARDVEKVAEAVGLRPLLKRKVEELSGGQLQRVAIAKILLVGASVVVFDEPLAHLDLRSARSLLGDLLALKEGGKTVILIEHRFRDLAPILPKVDKIILLDRGRVVDVFKGGEALGRADVLRKHGIRVEWRAPPRSPSYNGAVRVSVSGVWFSYGRHQVLRGVDLELREGVVYALIGPNGSGKSTLLKIITGVLKPERGSVKVEGVVGYLPQNPDVVLFYQTVREEVAARAQWWAGGGAADVADEFINALNLGELRGRNPHSLSRGQRFRAAFAAVLALRPDVLLLDETTVGQDLENLEAICALLREYVGRGKTALVATHDLRFVAGCCDYAYVLSDGRIAARGPAGEVAQSAEAVYGRQD
ncbi:ATP-binding cassette domain-containing protein [Pyrobaculum sp. 3827-6]|uniref:ABC transporter ATP-binding protein n=1 Tax=Pyrobaculum sp. 3827-6 TaxID=2983604 RepID=UPI0021DB791E|nr:ATP-binding cassette domain-containing protein [Pyrobaculum sp. 3827-6]MCU7787533.1 ATP-binding cassette domain-containing protein [Pyrobaculum sp. 3827-6]